VLHAPDVICLTEIAPKKCREPIQLPELAIEGYDMFVNLDNMRRGVGIYVKEELKAVVSKAQALANFEENV